MARCRNASFFPRAVCLLRAPSHLPRALSVQMLRALSSPPRIDPCKCWQFENVAREWRCKWKDDGGGKASSQTLVDIADLVDEYLPKLKALEGAQINRAVCGGCLDFKLCTTVPLSTFGPWEDAGHPPETEFLSKLKNIAGVSQVETQTMTNQML